MAEIAAASNIGPWSGAAMRIFFSKMVAHFLL